MTSLRTFVAAALLAACTATFAQADAAKKPPAAQPTAAAASGAQKHHQGKGHHSKDHKAMSDADCKAMMDKQHGKEGQSHDKQMADSHCAGMK